jgi:N-acyl-D-amino-acid deacylase
MTRSPRSTSPSRPLAGWRPFPLALGAALLAWTAGCGGSDAPGAESMKVPDAPAAASPPTVPGPWDLAVHGAQVVDGSGEAAWAGGLLAVDGQIVYVGPLDPDTLAAELADAEIIDAEGRVLAPGFIDAHAHGDPLETPGFPNFLAQGVTTIVLGMDGGSPPAGELAGVMAATERLGPWTNVAWLAGHGTLRQESPLGFGAPTAEGLEALAALVSQALDAGALGVSTGLEYDSGRPATADELARVGQEVARRGGIVSSHMRNEDADQVEASLAELIEQGRRSGARVHASHLKAVLSSDPALADRVLGLMDAARAEGLEVSADVYPYTASFTGIGILFPDWARPPASYEAAVAGRRDELLAHLRARVESRNGPGATLFGSGPWAGRTLEEAAAAAGVPFEELLLELGPSGARAAYFVMDDAIMSRFLLDPHTVVSSDGSPGMAHPRGYGAFARMLRRFVAEEGALPLEEAVRKMSGLTADLFRISDPAYVGVPRGYLRPGFAADFVVFDLERIADTADFENPHRLAEGLHGAWVNGTRAWGGGIAPGAGTAAGPGAVVRAR